MNPLSILIRVTISVVIGATFSFLWTLVNRKKRLQISILVGLTFGVLTWIGIRGLRLIPSQPVDVEIISPSSRTQVSDQITTVYGTVSPADSRVIILVHPWDADHWWVQKSSTVRIDEETNSAVWEAQIVLGEDSIGQGEAYEIIALGSQDPLFFDVLVGRYLAEGDEVVGLPVLSQSNSLILIRTE